MQVLVIMMEDITKTASPGPSGGGEMGCCGSKQVLFNRGALSVGCAYA